MNLGRWKVMWHLLSGLYPASKYWISSIGINLNYVWINLLHILLLIMYELINYTVSYIIIGVYTYVLAQGKTYLRCPPLCRCNFQRPKIVSLQCPTLSGHPLNLLWWFVSWLPKGKWKKRFWLRNRWWFQTAKFVLFYC